MSVNISFASWTVSSSFSPFSSCFDRHILRWSVTVNYDLSVVCEFQWDKLNSILFYFIFFSFFKKCVPRFLTTLCRILTVVKEFVRWDRRMLMLYPLFFLPLLTATEITQPTMLQERWKLQLEKSRNPADWIGDDVLNAVDTVLPVARSSFEGIRIKSHVSGASSFVILLFSC